MWITLTEADVLTRITAPELAAIKTAATAPGQENLLTETIASIVREVRGHVAACERNTLGPEGTIPDELGLAALNRIRYEIATRLPIASLLTEQRVKSNEGSVRLLEKTAACQFLIVQPAEAGPQPTAPLEAYHGSAEKITF
jgi:hypothetical protein